MPRGKPAQTRRRTRRATGRSEETGVGKARVSAPQALIAEGTEVFAIPADVNYRPASSGEVSCSTCSHFDSDDGTCLKYNSTEVEGDYVCDTWEEVEAEAEAEDDEMTAAADEEFAPTKAACAECSHPAGMHADADEGENMGECSVQGCDCMSYSSKSKSAADAEAFQNTTRCECGHSYSEHAGADGTCGHMDGRGTCSCSKFAEMQVEDSFDETMSVKLTMRDFRLLSDGTELTFTISPSEDGLTADVSLPDEHQPGEELPAPHTSPPPPEPQPTVAGSAIRWRAMIVPEAEMTDDGRAFAPNSITWRDLPLSLGAMLDTPHADVVTKAEVCGRIDTIWRVGNELWAEGIFDSGEWGQKIAQMVADGTISGVSVDVAVKQYEVGSKEEYFDEDGAWIDQGDEAEEKEPPSLLDMLFGGEDAIFVVTEGVIGAVTVCPFPAFADAHIDIASSLSAAASPAVWTMTHQPGFRLKQVPASGEASGEGREGIEVALGEEATLGLTASAAGIAPVAPPVEWFDDPELEAPTPLTVDDDGRVYGHAWLWETCHIGLPGCTTAPHTEKSYAYFHLGEVLCEGGERVACGQITIDTGHADRGESRADATAHYDHTGTAAADVVCGEDEFGGWVAGAVRSDVPAEKVRVLRGAKLSGDWRNVGGSLELVALLTVNVPGFPVPRPRANVAVTAGGEPEVLSLVAAGMNPLSTADDLDYRKRFAALKKLADEERASADGGGSFNFEALRARADARFAELAAAAHEAA